MTRRDDVRLNGREPEFSRMSLRPGIGHDFMHEVASAFLQFDLDKTESDVPVTLRHGASQLPLGRYLTRNLRKMVGRDEKAPKAVYDKMAEEMRPLREAQFNSETKKVSLKEVVQAKNKGKVAAHIARSKIFKPRKNI